MNTTATRAYVVADTFRSDRFTWEASTGVAEASDLGYRAGQVPTFIKVRSTKTGSLVTFAQAAQQVVEGDLLCTFYRNHDGSLSLTVFND